MSNSEEATYKDMRLVQEMYARGFEFLPIDLYQSDARYFKIVDGKLLPPFNTIPNMGDKAAESLQIAAKERKFLSKDDLRQRGKISKTNIEDMERMGIIRGLPESNQLSLFDFGLGD
jgi:DNA polymerase-3 subunit alpha (Gram-positive type)